MGALAVYFDDGPFGSAELTAAVLDGHLVALGEGYVAADAVETAALRLASLAPLLGEDAAATHASAAWVLGACDEPPVRHSVQRISTRRTRHRIDSRYVYRDPMIDPADLLRLRAHAVTTPARTIADLMRDADPDADRLVPGLLALHPEALSGARAWFAARRVPGKRTALARLRGYEEVTR